MAFPRLCCPRHAHSLVVQKLERCRVSAMASLQPQATCPTRMSVLHHQVVLGESLLGCRTAIVLQQLETEPTPCAITGVRGRVTVSLALTPQTDALAQFAISVRLHRTRFKICMGENACLLNIAFCVNRVSHTDPFCRKRPWRLLLPSPCRLRKRRLLRDRRPCPHWRWNVGAWPNRYHRAECWGS